MPALPAVQLNVAVDEAKVDPVTGLIICTEPLGVGVAVGEGVGVAVGDGEGVGVAVGEGVGVGVELAPAAL